MGLLPQATLRIVPGWAHHIRFGGRPVLLLLRPYATISPASQVCFANRGTSVAVRHCQVLGGDPSPRGSQSICPANYSLSLSHDSPGPGAKGTAGGTLKRA